MPYPIAPVPAARTTASAPAVRIVLVIAESPLSVSASSDCRRAVRRDRRGWRRPPALSWVAPATPFREGAGGSVARPSGEGFLREDHPPGRRSCPRPRPAA